jgi:hypothetical protein
MRSLPKKLGHAGLRGGSALLGVWLLRGRRVAVKRVLLLGDSIRLGYQPFVAAALAGRAVVEGPTENCESSRVLRSMLRVWVPDRPDVVHVNCGLHDVRYDPGSEHENVPIAEYEENVEAIPWVSGGARGRTDRLGLDHARERLAERPPGIASVERGHRSIQRGGTHRRRALWCLLP